MSTHDSIDEEIGRLIMIATKESLAREDEQRARGVQLTNGPLARLMSLDIQPKGFPFSEVILIQTQEGLRRMRLVAGETRFLDSRRQWGAFRKAHELLQSEGLSISESEVDHKIRELFQFTYGVMGICRRYDASGECHVLMGIRSNKLGTLNVGRVSFPAGLVEPGEHLQDALIREFEEETGIDRVTYYPGYAVFAFPDACSMTFTGLLETRSRQSIKSCFEVKGGTYTWIPESALREAISGSPKQLVASFRDQGVNVKDDIAVTNDGAATYLRLSQAYPA